MERTRRLLGSICRYTGLRAERALLEVGSVGSSAGDGRAATSRKYTTRAQRASAQHYHGCNRRADGITYYAKYFSSVAESPDYITQDQGHHRRKAGSMKRAVKTYINTNRISDELTAMGGLSLGYGRSMYLEHTKQHTLVWDCPISIGPDGKLCVADGIEAGGMMGMVHRAKQQEEQPASDALKLPPGKCNLYYYPHVHFRGENENRLPHHEELKVRQLAATSLIYGKAETDGRSSVPEVWL
eukprot:6200392-Pleurochrysis_carterae.AAC.1